MSSVDGFISDLKLQAQRDLEGAEIILKNEGPIEHAAWYCEQSFEKTVKYVYAYFKLKVQTGNLDSVHDNMRERKHYGTGDLVLNLMRELYRGYAENIAQFMQQFATLPEIIQSPIKELFDKLPKNPTGQFDKWFDQGRDKIAELLRDRQSYNDAIGKSTAERLRMYIERFNYDQRVDDIVTNETRRFAGIVDIGIFADPSLYKGINFPMKVMALSPWILPYTEMSRYPLKECSYINLQLFRQHESTLREYFTYLVEVLKQLQKDADNYIDSMNTFSKAMGR